MTYQDIPPGLNNLSNEIIGLAIKVHKALGPGLLESSYKECLFYEIVNAGFFAEKEKKLPLVYGDVKLDVGYRIDILVENKLVVEIKALEALADIFPWAPLTARPAHFLSLLLA